MLDIKGTKSSKTYTHRYGQKLKNNGDEYNPPKSVGKSQFSLEKPLSLQKVAKGEVEEC